MNVSVPSPESQWVNSLIMSILTNPPIKGGDTNNVPAYLLICRLSSIVPPINPTIDEVYRLTVKLIDDCIRKRLVDWMLTHWNVGKRVLVLGSLPVIERIRLGEFPTADELFMKTVAISVNCTFDVLDGREQAICDWLDFTASRDSVQRLDAMVVGLMSWDTITMVLEKCVNRCTPHMKRAVEVQLVKRIAFD